MTNVQILNALNLPATTDNKNYAAKLVKICGLIAEIKKLPGYGFEVGPDISNTELAAKVENYKLSPLFPKQIGSEGRHNVYPDNHSAEDIIKNFATYQHITVRHAGGEYSFDIPANNAFCAYVLNLVGAQAMPEVQTPEKRAYYRAILPAEAISKIKTAMTFCSKDTLRPAMTGVCLTFHDRGRVSITGTDAHQLYTTELRCEATSDKRREFVLPFDVCKVLTTFKRRDINEPIEFRVHRHTWTEPREIWSDKGRRLETPIIKTKILNKLIFSIVNTSGGNLDMSGHFVGAKFPEYQRFIPELADQVYNVEMDRKTLLQHIANNLPTANKTTSQIKFHFKGRVAIEAQDIDFQYESKTEFDYISSVNREDFEIAFNGKLLAGILKNMSSKTVKFAMRSYTRGALICDPTNEDTRLLMPLNLG